MVTRSFKFSPEIELYCKKNKLFLRHPFKIEGVLKYGENILVARNVIPERYATMPPKGFASFGAYTYCRSRISIGELKAGRYCSIAQGLIIMGMAHPTDWVTSHVATFRDYYSDFAQREFGIETPVREFDFQPHPVTLGHDVWVGQNVMIKGGVNIGTGAIVAAGSVVVKDVEPYTLVAGVPAKVVRHRFGAETCAKLLKLRWWEYNFIDFVDLPIADIHRFTEMFAERVDQGQIKPFEPGFLSVAEDLAELDMTMTESRAGAATHEPEKGSS